MENHSDPRSDSNHLDLNNHYDPNVREYHDRYYRELNAIRERGNESLPTGNGRRSPIIETDFVPISEASDAILLVTIIRILIFGSLFYFIGMLFNIWFNSVIPNVLISSVVLIALVLNIFGKKGVYLGLYGVLTHDNGRFSAYVMAIPLSITILYATEQYIMPGKIALSISRLEWLEISILTGSYILFTIIWYRSVSLSFFSWFNKLCIVALLSSCFIGLVATYIYIVHKDSMPNRILNLINSLLYDMKYNVF